MVMAWDATVTLCGGTSLQASLLNNMNPDEEDFHRLMKCLRKKQELIFALPCWVGDGEDFLERHFKVVLSPPRPKSGSDRDHVPTDSELARARSPLPSSLSSSFSSSSTFFG